MQEFFIRIGRWLKAIWLQVGICLLFLVVLDGAAAMMLRMGPPKDVDPRIHADAFKRAAWAPELLADMSGAWIKWNPYTYWIEKPYHSRYMNIGANGMRVTPDSRAVKPGAIRVFMFGGSTMWGDGARDAYTIPAWLQRMLNQTPYSVRVFNYGQDGYVSTQEMLLLFEQLRKGNIPDLVIFYDGFNDSTAAMIDGVAGETFGEANRRVEFNAFNQWSTDNSILYKHALRAFLINSGLGRLAARIVHSIAPRRFQVRKGRLVAIRAGNPAAEQETELQRQVVSTYVANLRLIEAAGRRFGFKCLFFWQPTVWTKINRTPYEAEQKWLPGEQRFMTGVYKRVAEIASQDEIHDLSGVFGLSREPYYLDDAHITGAGNGIVAHAMLPYVVQIVKQLPPQTPGTSTSSPTPVAAEPG